jgi:transposase InsO family protein
VRQPGDRVEVDTMDLRPLPGLIRKQFTSRDLVSPWDGLSVGRTATAAAATRFLEALSARPTPFGAMQVDGGREVMAGFAHVCQQRGIPLFVLPPRRPKLNGCVERANRTHAAAFWECSDGALDLPTAQAALLAWEHRSNTYRRTKPWATLRPRLSCSSSPSTKGAKCNGSPERVHYLDPHSRSC